MGDDDSIAVNMDEISELLIFIKEKKLNEHLQLFKYFHIIKLL